MRTKLDPMFDLGRTLATPGAITVLAAAGQSPAEFLARHVRGDWGEVPPEDAAENEYALGRNLRIMSAYRIADESRLWVITEADRSGTRGRGRSRRRLRPCPFGSTSAGR